jgi:hypothetical protein
MGCSWERRCGVAEDAERSLLLWRGYESAGDWSLLLRRRCGAGCVALAAEINVLVGEIA